MTKNLILAAVTVFLSQASFANDRCQGMDADCMHPVFNGSAQAVSVAPEASSNDQCPGMDSDCMHPLFGSAASTKTTSVSNSICAASAKAYVLRIVNTASAGAMKASDLIVSRVVSVGDGADSQEEVTLSSKLGAMTFGSQFKLKLNIDSVDGPCLLKKFEANN